MARVMKSVTTNLGCTVTMYELDGLILVGLKAGGRVLAITTYLTYTKADGAFTSMLEDMSWTN